jgi:hypothetical protein
MVIQWLALAISQESVEGFEYDQIACVVWVHSIGSNIKKQNLFKTIPLKDVACLSESPWKSMVMHVYKQSAATDERKRFSRAGLRARHKQRPSLLGRSLHPPQEF